MGRQCDHWSFPFSKCSADDLVMSDADLIFFGALAMMAIGFVLMLIILPLWFILHRILSERLDPILLREPYFQKSEQLNCLVWPLSYWKSGIYFTLVAAPNISRRKRFKGLDEALPVGAMLTIACKVQFWLMVSGGVLGVVWFCYLVWGAYIYPHM